MKRKAFISHSSHDHNIAQKICAIFEKNGIACWMAPRDIRPGKDWDAEILRGLNESSVLLLLLSRYSNQSPEVKRELGLANRKNHEIYPIRLENIEPSENLEYFLTFNQWTDVWEGQMEGRLTKIMQAVKAAWGSNGEDGSEEIPGTFTPRLLETLDFAPADYVAAGGLSRDKKKLVLASRKEIKIFDFETLRELATLHGHAEQITSLRFKGSDANTVVSADRQKIITWDFAIEKTETNAAFNEKMIPLKRSDEL